MVKQLTVISLFSGCGGSSLGYKWAGYKELLAIDFDKDAVETFRLNFPDVPYWQRDIREVTGRDILDFCKIKKGELGLLDASPPCQGFSTAGKRMVTDSRNDLFLEFVRLINELEPKVFVMENVSGMAKGKMRGRFNEIMRALKGTGYQIKCKLMNAKWYSVPQNRQRLIWVGVKDGNPIFPIPSKKIITAKQAIGYLNEKQDAFPSKKIVDIWENSRGGEKLTPYGLGPIKIKSDRPVNTIRGPGAGGRAGGWNNFHYEFARPLTVNEIKILSSFPIDFKLSGKRRDQISLLGNAVPPKFMEAIARTIKEGILDHAPIS